MGAVMEISTRRPDSLTGSIAQTQALQKFDLYGTSNTFGTSQTSADVGNRWGRLAVFASGTYQVSHSQPLAYVTAASFPSGTTGGFGETNKLGASANVLGATGLQHTGMANGNLKASYDLTPTIRATYTLGLWRNDATSVDETYIAKAGTPTFAGQAGFTTGFFRLDQQHASHSLALRSDNKGDWDFEAVAATYRFDKDQQRFPTSSSASDTTFSNAGRVAVLDGTAWSSVDGKGVWHRGGLLSRHVIAFGAHHDAYALKNPTYNLAEWREGAFGAVATEGDGGTRTNALWMQDAWRLSDMLKVTVGGRYETWRAFDGFNASGSTVVTQPEAVAVWTPTMDWTYALSVGKAYRFATAAELYQLVSTGTTFTSPDPNLRPDNVLASELRATRTFARGMAQVALFQDDVHDAIISQFLTLLPGSNSLFSYLANVDHVRARGAEMAFAANDVLVHGLELSGSATWLDAKTLALSGRASATAPAGSAIGAQLPNIPKWRANFVTTWRPDNRLALTVAGRYSGMLYTTLDNADVHPNTYQGFGEWFVADTHANYRFDQHWSASLGVDNLLDRKYFLFHPFPQRTFIGSAKWAR